MATVMSNNYIVNFETHTPVLRSSSRSSAIGAHTRFAVFAFFGVWRVKRRQKCNEKEGKNDRPAFNSIKRKLAMLGAPSAALRLTGCDQIT